MQPFSMLVVGVLSSTAPSWAGSWTVNSSGGALHWEQATVPYQLNPNGKHGLHVDDVESAVLSGAEEWNLEGSWIELVYEGQTDTATATNEDGQFVVFFEEEWSENLSPDLLALTYVWSYDDGAITHFDIAINTDGHTWGVDGAEGANDLQNALTHEFGHVLGLDHSEDVEATMFFQTAPGEVLKRDLSEDDVETYASVYGGSYPFEMAERLGCSALGGGSVPGGALLGLMLVGARRRRSG